MKIFKNVILLLSIIIISTGAKAQILDADVPRDNFYDKIWITEKKPVELPYVREVEVMFAKTIWQVIDMREKINQPLYYPTTPIQDRRSLVQVIVDGIREGAIQAYDDDEFTQPLTIEAVMDRLEDEDEYTDEDGVTHVTTIPFQSEDVTQFRMKEVWFVDSKRSVLDVRILGLSPIRYIEIAGELSAEELFWVYYPHIRNVLVNAEVFNRHNDAQRVSYDDIFLRRMFNAFIYKETNVHDRTIREYYANGLDQLLEADRIRSEIRNYEIDLWEY